MDNNERIIAITRILPGLETFLRQVLANESLSQEAERQRVEFVKEIEELTKPPGLPPRPANLKSQSRASVDSVESVENDNDFASVQRKLSNIFYVRRDFDELKEHFVNGTVEDGNVKNTTRKTPVKSGKKKSTGKGIYEDLPTQPDIGDLETGVLSEEEGQRITNRSISLARGTHIRQSLSRGKWFAKKEKPMSHDVYVSDLQLPTISGHLLEVRTNKRRWCVLKDQHLYIFKNQEEAAHFVIALPGCDISTVPRGDKSKVSYSFKITQDGVAAVILGIEEEKDLSAWMNALITASVAKHSLSPPPTKISKTLPRSVTSPWSEKEESSLDDQAEGRRHTLGSYPGYKVSEIVTEIDIGTYEQPADALGLAVSLDTENYNPPLPPLPGELSDVIRVNSKRGRPWSKYSGIYEEVGEEFLRNHASDENLSENLTDSKGDESEDISGNERVAEKIGENLVNGNLAGNQPNYSEGATSDSEYSSDEDEQSLEVKDEGSKERLFHDRWAVHSGVLYQKRVTGWNRRYCKIIDECLKGYRNPNDLTPVLELNLSACNVRAAEAEGKRKFIFQLNTAESESLYFNTDTQESLERWIEVISVAATSRPDNSVNLSEEELDKVDQTSSDQHGSRDSTPSPVPERVESLRRSRVISTTDDGACDTVGPKKCETVEKRSLSHDDVSAGHWNSNSTVQQPVEYKDSEGSLKSECVNNTEENVDIWERRVVSGPYSTTPRSRSKHKEVKSSSSKDLSRSTSIQSLKPQKYAKSPQEALHISKKHKYKERLKKYLDTSGQFSGFILELRIKPNSTNLTRRWAVVQNGFLRIYENYGCAAPFLRISLVEAFLKDFSNVEKSRFCFMLEYGAGQSILFQTNTHQELKKWITVITLSIACHTDLFGSGLDLRRTERMTGNSRSAESSSQDVVHHNSSINKHLVSKSTDEVDGPDEVMLAGGSSNVFEQRVTPSRAANDVNESCECNHDDDKVSTGCTPAVVKEVIHRKSYSMASASSLDSHAIIARNCRESFAYRSSLLEMVKYRGYLRVSRGTEEPLLQFCELKGSLFSIYPNEKSENPKQVFNLLYDRYREVSNEPLSFTLNSDDEGSVIFGCETKENFESWERAINSVALQEPSSCDVSPQNTNPRKRSSFRASVIAEEAKHREILRSLNEEIAKGELQCAGSDYRCYVYEVRDSSGNKTIIRRWCVIKDDVIQIFDRETSREAVTELRPSTCQLKDIESPRDFPFAFKLEPLEAKDPSQERLVIQASNVKDFRELMKRIRSVQERTCKKRLSSSKSESQLLKKNSFRGGNQLNHARSDLSIKKEVKRIFHLSRKSSKSELMNDHTPSGQNTWPKVIRREKKTNRRALSDTGTERPITKSLIEYAGNLDYRKSVGYFYDSDGKFSGYLTEVRNNELCRSEVRKWCVVQNQQFSAYDDKDTKLPSTVIQLKDVQLVDMSHVYPGSFEFRVSNGVIQCHLYHAPCDFHKWLTVLNVAIEVCHKQRTKSAPEGYPEKLGSNVKRKDSKKVSPDPLISHLPSAGYLISKIFLRKRGVRLVALRPTQHM